MTSLATVPVSTTSEMISINIPHDLAVQIVGSDAGKDSYNSFDNFLSFPARDTTGHDRSIRF